jgi:DNA-directed RNA polymerase specialized sigma24 family protein
MFAPTFMVSLQALVSRTVAGDGAAWTALQRTIEPIVSAMARRHPLLRKKGLAALPDDVAEVVTSTLERLARGEFQNLRRFLERFPLGEDGAGWRDSELDDWLYGTVDYVIREHVRTRFGRAPKQPSSESQVLPSKRDVHTQAGRLDETSDRSFLRTLGMTAKLTAGEIFAHIERDFTPEEARAMRLYFLDDQSIEAIAQALDLPNAKAADRLIRRLNARLRYHFVEADAKSRTGA